MMKKIFALLLAISLSIPTIANEGMWLPLLLNKNYAEMQEMGLQLTPEQLYSVNNSSLKDAIVSLGGFCTGEIISSNGLLLTNHHCGFGSIQSHSDVENDYLTDGFWAKSYDEEKPNDGLFVRFLVRIENVTEKVSAELNDEMTEAERDEAVAEIGKTITEEATEDNHYDADVKSFYHNNEFYLFVYETYNDVRLVGAPPSSVGKFGGDTDNWMWPRHTGDFSLFRVYMSPDGEPAEYSEENIPLKPKHHLPISLDGVKEGDFTMIFGYPGSTDRYLSSYGVKQAIEKYNPTVVSIRDKKLEIMKKYMDADPATRIAYAAKYAQTSNYWKYYIGQTEQLKNNKVYDKKAAIETHFNNWMNVKPERKEKYGETLNLLKDAYAATDNHVVGNVYVLEAGLLGANIALFSYRMDALLNGSFALKAQMEEKLKEAENEEAENAVKEEYEEKINALMSRINATVEKHFKDYNPTLDQELLASVFEMYYKNVPTEQQPTFLQEAGDKYKGDFTAYAENIFEKSILASKESVLKFLEKPNAKKIQKDAAATMGRELYAIYRGSAMAHADADEKKAKGYRLLTAGLREMLPNKNYSPDANSTMRMTYGTVGSYYPRDGVFYNYYTTAQGILQKEDPNDMEFIVPEYLTELIEKKDFGQYANTEGELPVCFISNNDITGGNSGSPVINGKGELIGTAFDGNWEAMSGDIFFETTLQRTISVDARYMLFIIDKYAGATNLIEEMTIVKTEDTVAEEEAPADLKSAM